MTKRSTCVLFMLLATAPRSGRADPSSADKAMATQLYDDAEKLSAASNHAAACPKYAESHRRDPQLGTLLHLADCYEKVGKTASAWASFKDAVEVAARKNATGQTEPREQTARTRAAALEGKLSRLMVTVKSPDAPGLEVQQDGDVLGKAAWGASMPVDPGSHTITARAADKKPWTKTVDVAANGAKVEIAVPDLEPMASTGAGATPGPAAVPSTGASTSMDQTIDTKSPSSRRTAGFVVGGVGVASIGVGVVFGLMRNSKISERDGICPSGVHCTRDEATRINDLTDGAKSNGTMALVAFGLGGAALIGGAVLVFTAPSGNPSAGATSARVAPWAAPGAFGVNVGGAW